MAALYNLPFGLPVKSISSSLNGVEAAVNAENVNLLKKVFDSSGETTKQEDHFIYEDWLGTYTYEEYTDDYGNIQGRYTVDNSNITNIIVIVPAEYTVDNLEFRLVLDSYEDQYLSWYYEGDEYMSDDYFPTVIDMKVLTDGEKVLDLYMTAEWQYFSVMEDVMPIHLQITLELPPYTMQATYSNETSNVLSYDMTLKENNVTMMSMDAMITFTDATLDEVSEVDLGYGFGDYYIDFWSDVINMDEMMESEQYTMDDKVDLINGGDYITCFILDNDVQIGRLMAKIIWDEDEWNEEDQDYTGDYVIVPYILFNDGSQMDEQTLAALFGDFGGDMK